MIRVLFFSFFSLGMFMAGCKKSEGAITVPEENIYNVSFSVSNLTKKLDAPTSAEDTLKNFSYYIFNSSGYRVKTQETQLLQSPSSVRLKEKLEPGNYKVIFFASEKPLEQHIADGPGEIPSFIQTGTSDIYYKTIDIIVGNGIVDQTVALEKLNSYLEFEFLDQSVPSNVASIQVSWTDDKYLDFNGASFTSSRKQKSIKLTTVNQSRKAEKFSTLIFNTSTPFSIYISYLDINGRPIGSKEISNIKCLRSEKTVLSGYLFSPQSTAQKTGNYSVKEAPFTQSAL